MKMFLLLMLFSLNAEAKLQVLTTTTDLRAIAAEVGGDFVEAESIARGTQDAHFLEAKPSFMLKANRADLVLAIGLELETGWLPNILRGARNPKLQGLGFLEVGPGVKPLEVAQWKLSRAEGDVHPGGNPHLMLDPLRAGEVAMLVAKRLGELDAAHATAFAENAARLKHRLEAKTKDWQARLIKSGVKSVVSYHKTYTYFFDRFGIRNPAILEPKPGIPPTSSHIIEVTEMIKRDKIPLVMVENYFDPAVTNKIKSAVPGLRVAVTAVSVEGEPKVKNLDDLYESLVSAVEGK